MIPGELRGAYRPLLLTGQEDELWMLDDVSADNGATRTMPAAILFPGRVGE